MKCPLCHSPHATDYRPFCSRRCADIDLLKWLNADYRVPLEPIGDEESNMRDDE